MSPLQPISSYLAILITDDPEKEQKKKKAILGHSFKDRRDLEAGSSAEQQEVSLAP